MRYQKLFLSFVIALVIAAIAAAVLPSAPIKAQTPTPTPSCTPVITEPVFIFPELPTDDGWANSDVPAESLMWDTDLGEYGPWVHSTYTIYDNYYLYFEGGSGAHYAAVRLSAEDFLNRIGVSGTSFPSENLYAVRWYSSESTGDTYSWFIVEYSDGSISEYQAGAGGYHYREHNVSGKNIVAFYLWSEYVAESGYIYVADAQMYYNGCQDAELQTCPTVQDYHFTDVPTGTWTLDNGATIFSSTLIINLDGMAGQNLVTDTIISDIPYNAAISVTAVTAPTDLLVWLYDVTQTVSITQPGLYTATFTITNSTVAGQSAGYLLWNLSDTGLAVDWTCIYTGTRSWEEVGCLSGLPVNGYFNTANYWEWYRGAEWKSTQKNAWLPYSDRGLIYYTPTLTLPTIYEGENLILTYNARGACSDDGVIGSLIENPELISGTSILNYHGTFQNTYTYEDDISDLAGYGTWLFFANPGVGFTSTYTSTDDIYLDNICVFIASRPISAPFQTDPNETVFLDTSCAIGGSGGLGGLSDCDDVDGIWASFGVNMAYYRAVYAEGTSIWDPIGWVPWLISAIFVTLADWSCFFLAAYIGLMNFLGWLLNNILNIFDWLRRYLTQLLTYVDAFLEWLQSWFWFYWAMFYGFVSWLIGYMAYWIAFLRLSWNSFSAWAISTVIYWVQWIYTALGWLDDWVNNFWDSVRVYLSGQFYFIQEIYNFIVAAINMSVTFLWWIWTNFISVGQLPINFYWGFNNAINSTAYNAFISCSGETSFWCVFLAGVQIINQTMSQSVFYPIVIVCIILATVVILWRDIRGVFSA